MPSPSSLPSNPDLRQLKNQAKSLLKAFRAAELSAAVRLRQASPAMAGLTDEEIFQTKFALKDAQRTIALEHGFDTWQALANHIKSMLEPSAPVEADVDPRTRRIEQLVRAGLMSPREAKYVLEGGTGWLVELMTKGGEYTESDLEFMDAALLRRPLRNDTPDVERMQAMLVETPELIETAGPAALANAVQTKESQPAVEFLIQRGVSRITLNPLEHN